MFDNKRKKNTNLSTDHAIEYPDLFFRSLFEGNPNIAFYMDVNGVIALPNKHFSECLDYTNDEIILNKFDTFLPDKEALSYKEALKNVMIGKNQYINTVLIHKNGTQIECQLTLMPARSQDHIIGAFGLVQDLTNKNLLKKSLIESELKFRSFADEASFGIFIFQGNQLIYGNPKFHTFMGPYLINNECLLDALHPDDHSTIQSNINELTVGGIGKDVPFRTIKEDGTHYYECHIKKIMYQNQATVVGSVQEVTKYKKAQLLTKFLADHDELTGLPNSRFFREKLEQEIVVSKTLNQKLAVMYVDLDRFKYINDTLGHPIGDEFLKQFADKLTKILDHHQFAARIGADEFLILCPNVFRHTVTQQAEKIINAFDAPFIVKDYRLPISLSIGISVFPRDGEDSTSLIKHADAALHQTKENKQSNYQMYTHKMNIVGYKRFTLASDLQNSLELSQFELYYQPKVDIATQRIIGAEALIRWNHPEWGLVSPAEFIPLAEEIGMMRQIDRWIEYTACLQNKAWQDKDLPAIPISINLSATRFLDHDLTANLLDVLGQTHLDPKYLEVEIVETALLENEKTVFTILDSLRQNGIGINLDDFGTGYSSLSYLKRFKGRINTLKIDKSFIDALSDTDDESSKYIIKSIIELAHHLKMKVVAEGVEAQEQLQLLQDFHCNLIQGYLFSKPVPADTFTELLRKERVKAPVEPISRRREVYENRRKHFRVDLDYPLSAMITLVQFHEQHVQLGNTRILIENIGLGGLRFLSDLRFGIDSSLILKVETNILGKKMTFLGSVVWTKELKSEVFQYDFKFIMNENERKILSQLLNKFALLLNENPLPPDCDFVTTDKYSVFAK
ncbi:EAL domain-containing protein [Sporolactobacillus nakayamae]|uniref:PAS domain S-box-containing protein/diguanylate cyclase (GGDEF) domain-containing protein n=1 Tax=Sporolactobacillus nakayamae TaxID=269670 RepID=A0A1I2PPY9_9BACL|nr:EAL domain-containing protein [Sporolactobacillus nakayamae]SFG17680.1 PAS domain S-box-containing protein/diguanylate cyclase (GGDEF) domain-containing protein [Sporolactobacillus nakayamae]